MRIVKSLINIAKQIVSLFAAFAVFILSKNEYLIFAGMIVVIAISFWIEYKKWEWKVLALGITLGFLLEIAGDSIYKLQYWNGSSLLGIPLWLPLFWGYGFVMIRRIGNMLMGK